MKIQVLTDTDDQEVQEFLDRLGVSSPSVLFYHYPVYRNVLSRLGLGDPFYVGARIEGELVGFLPGFLRRGEPGLAYCSMPFFGPNAGVLCAPGGRAAEIHNALLRFVLEAMRRNKDALTASFYTPFLAETFGYYDDTLTDPIIVSKFTQYLSLSEINWNGKIRYDLRKAERLGLEISSEVSPERLEVLYEIYEHNCLEHGIPLKPRKAVDELSRAHVPGGRIRFYFGLLDKEMMTGLVALWGPQTVSYYLPCTRASARPLRLSTALLDRAMAEAREQGLRFWNWESSPSRESSVYEFKKKFGSREGMFRIYVVPFRKTEAFRQIGRQRLATEFPHFFVFPYDRLS